MTLQEAIRSCQDLSQTSTIYVERTAGRFRPNSLVVLVEEGEDGLDMSTSEIAEKYAAGKQYFLEVSILSELVSDLRSSYESGSEDVAKLVERVIRYAENDA